MKQAQLRRGTGHMCHVSKHTVAKEALTYGQADSKAFESRREVSKADDCGKGRRDPEGSSESSVQCTDCHRANSGCNGSTGTNMSGYLERRAKCRLQDKDGNDRDKDWHTQSLRNAWRRRAEQNCHRRDHCAPRSKNGVTGE